MNVVQRIAKNTLALITASIINMVLGLLYGIYTARYLGPERYGTISFAIAFIGLFSILTDIGLQQLVVREVARDRSLASKYMGNILVLKLFLVAITYGLIAVAINILNYPETTIQVVYLMALSTVFGAFSAVFNSIFQSFERMEYVSIGSILNGALMLAGGLFAVEQGFSVVGFAFVYLYSSLIVLVYNIFIAIKFGFPLRPQIDNNFLRQIIRRALPFGVGSFFLAYYVWIGRVLLSYMVNNQAVGYYTAAYNIMNVFTFVPTAFSISLFPFMSICAKESGGSLYKAYRTGLKYIYMLALPMATGTTLLGNQIIIRMYGQSFLPSTQALNILIWAEFFVFIDILLGQMLFSINKENITMINAGIGAALNIGINIILIPRIGIIGAAIATLSTEFYFFAMSYFIISRYGYGIKLSKLLPKPILAIIIMSVFVTNFSYINIFLLIPLSAVLYFVILYLTKYISYDDFELFRQLLAIKRKRSIE